MIGWQRKTDLQVKLVDLVQPDLGMLLLRPDPPLHPLPKALHRLTSLHSSSLNLLLTLHPLRLSRLLALLPLLGTLQLVLLPGVDREGTGEGCEVRDELGVGGDALGEATEKGMRLALEEEGDEVSVEESLDEGNDLQNGEEAVVSLEYHEGRQERKRGRRTCSNSGTPLEPNLNTSLTPTAFATLLLLTFFSPSTPASATFSALNHTLIHASHSSSTGIASPGASWDWSWERRTAGV